MQKQSHIIWIFQSWCELYQTFSGHHANEEVGNVGYRKIQSRTAYSPATQDGQLANFCPNNSSRSTCICTYHQRSTPSYVHVIKDKHNHMIKMLRSTAHLVDEPLSGGIHPFPVLWHKNIVLALNNLWTVIQGVFFNWYPPKIHKYGKKLKYQNWYPPKIHKYGKKLKYQNWYPPQIHKVSVDPAPDHAESRLPAQLLSSKPNMVVTSWHLEILGGTSTKVGNILLTKNT